jgi:hypothetical protein
MGKASPAKKSTAGRSTGKKKQTQPFGKMDLIMARQAAADAKDSLLADFNNDVQSDFLSTTASGQVTKAIVAANTTSKAKNAAVRPKKAVPSKATASKAAVNEKVPWTPSMLEFEEVNTHANWDADILPVIDRKTWVSKPLLGSGNQSLVELVMWSRKHGGFVVMTAERTSNSVKTWHPCWEDLEILNDRYCVQVQETYRTARYISEFENLVLEQQNFSDGMLKFCGCDRLSCKGNAVRAEYGCGSCGKR